MRGPSGTALLLCAPIAVAALTVGPAWADHGAGLRPGAMNPWLAALLWGALGMAVAMIVAIIVMVFTRAPVEGEQDERRRS
jgi:hypothetical protein